MSETTWVVYVVQSQQPRYSRSGKRLPGLFYVGCTTDITRRVKQHNGLLVGGAKYTAKHKPWVLRKIYGPYYGRSEAQKAEYALKHSKRGESRLYWRPEDSPLCRVWRDDVEHRSGAACQGSEPDSGDDGAGDCGGGVESIAAAPSPRIPRKRRVRRSGGTATSAKKRG